MADTRDTSGDDGFPTTGELLRLVVDALNDNLAALTPNSSAPEDTPEQPA